MKSVLTTLATMTALAALTQTARSQDEEQTPAVLQILPTQQVCTEPPQITLPVWATATVRSVYGMEDFDQLGIYATSRQFSPDSVHEFLQQLHESRFPQHEVAIDIEGGNLILLGHGGVIAQLRNDLDALRRAVTRPLTVEVALWAADDEAPRTGILDAASYDAFVANREPLWRRRSVTRSNRPVSLDSSHWNSYVRDVDVEIASKSWIHRPSSDAYFEGNHVVVLPHALTNSNEFVAHVQFAHSARQGDTGRISTGIPDAPQLDSIRLATMTGTFSGRFENGGALCTMMTGDADAGAAAVLTVRISARPTAAGAHTITDGVSAFPVSALTSMALLGRVGPPPLAPRIGDPHSIDLEFENEGEGFGHLSADRLSDLLYSAFIAADEDETQIRIGGGYLFVHGSKAASERAGELVQGLQDRILRAVTLHHSVRGQGPGSNALHEFVVPSLTGRYVTVARRFETNIIGQLNVEVAEEAKAVDPVVELLQFGGWLRARIVADDDRAHLDLLTQCSDCDLAPTRQMLPAGALDLAQVATQTLGYDAEIAAGQPILHGDGPVLTRGGQRRRTTVSTTVRW